MRELGGTRRIVTNRRWILLAVAILSLVGVVTLGGTAVAQSGTCDAVVQDGESIQDAINGSTAGTTVCVEDGTYETELTIDVEGLTLAAADGASPVLTGNETLNTAVVVNVSDVAIDGFEIRAYEDSSVVLDGASNATIRNVNVSYGEYSSDGHGIHVLNSPDAAVTDSVVLDHEHGIYVSGSDRVTIENVTATGHDDGVYATNSLNLQVTNSTLEESGSGVLLSSGADDAFVSNNSLNANNDYGVLLVDVRSAEVRDNDASEADSGIVLNGVLDSIVANNTVMDSHESGIYVGAHSIHGASANVSILDNVVAGSEDEGIHVEDSDGMTVTGNLVEDNANWGGGQDVGIHVRNSDDSTFADNVVRNNVARGIYLNGVEDTYGNHGPNRNAVLENNTVTGHDVSIDLRQSPNATIVDNDLDAGLVFDGTEFEDFDHAASNNTAGGDPIFFANGVDAPTIPADAAQVIVVDSTNVDVSGHTFDSVPIGVLVAYSDGALVDDNTLTGMGGSEEYPYDRGSIGVWGGTDVTVSSNVVDGSEWVGISAYDTVDASLLDNEVNATVQDGVYVSRAVGTTVSGNEITAGEDGLSVLDSSDDATITDNVVDGHQDGGVVLEQLIGVTVSNNTVSNNTDGIRLSAGDDYAVEDSLISGNEIVDNDGWGVDSGVQVFHENLTISSNVVERNGDGVSTSEDGTNQTVADNVVAENDDDGVYVRAGEVRNNTVIANGQHGIVVNADGVVENNTVSSNAEHGIEALGGQLLDNAVADNGMDGIYLDGYEDDRIANNTVSGHAVGLRTVESTNATIVDNAFESGIFVDGKRYGNYQGDLEYLQHEISNNTVGGDPLFYAGSVDDPNVPADAGQVILFNATNVSLADQSFEGIASPIQITYSEGVTLTNVSVVDSPIDGATIGVSENVTITASTISGSAGQGILAAEVGGFVLSESVVTANDGNGLTIEVLDPANGSALTNNTVTDNAVGIDLASELDFVGVTISGNVVHDNDEGLVLADDAVDLLVTANSFEDNGVGLVYDASYSPPDLNVTDNWWGNATGPSGGVTDACTATVADGDGDVIEEDEDGVVCFEPWLTEAPIDGPSATFTVSPSAPYEGDQVTFDASNSSAPDGIVEYRWDLTGDGSVDETTTDPTLTHTYAANGSYDVELTVEDANGVTDAVNQTVQVQDLEPLTAAFEWEPLTPEPGESVTFDASNATAPTGPIAEYRWDLTGDGSVDATTADPTLNHTYADAGSHAVELTVEDGSGQTNATTRTVHVADEGEAIWNVTTDELIDGSSPTVVDGTAYVGDENGTLYAVDVDTGDVEWRFHHDPYPDDDSPTVVDGVVYVASRESSTIDTDEHTLHAIDADTGDEVWNATLQRPPRGSTVYGDTVYVTTGGDWDVHNGYVLAFDADDGTQRWSYETTTPTTSAPTVTDGRVYVGDDVGTLYALDAGTGAEAWTWEGDDEIAHAPTVANGTVYVPVNDLIPDPDLDVNQYRGYVYALDAADGSTVWEDPFVDAEVDRGITAAPTVHNGTLYVAGGGDTLYAVDASAGGELWTFGTQAPIRAAPTVVEAPGELHRTIDEALVFAGNDDGNLYAVGTDTGLAHWIYDAGGWVRSSPTVANGVVYVGADYFEPGDPDTVGDDGVREGALHAVGTNVTRSSDDSRVVLGTLGHNELLQSYLDVEIASTSGTVLEGETMVVEATVSNTGQEATGTVELEDFGGTVVDSETVTVGRNGEAQVTLEFPTSAGDAGVGDVTVTTPNDADATEVAIQQEVDFAGCRDIDTPGVYTVTGGELSNSTCIEITSSYVEIDGNGIALQGGGGMDDGAHGIHVNGTDGTLTNVAIRDVYLVDWASFDPDNAAVRIDDVANSEFTEVTVEDSYYGIWADGLHDSVVNESDFTTTISAGISMESSTNNTIANVEIAEPLFGIDLGEGSNDTVVTDSVVAGTTYGLRVLDSSGVEISNVDARYNDPDLYRDDPVTVENYTLSAPSIVTIEEIAGEYSVDDTVYASDTVEANVSAVPAPDVTVTFEALNVDVEAVHSPAENPNAHALGQYVAVSEGMGDAAYLDLEVHYEEAHLDGGAESKLSLWRYDESDGSWSEIAGQSVDAGRNVVAANLTEFGTVGLFVDDPGSADPAAPPTSEVTGVTMIAAGDNPWQDLEESGTHVGGTNWSVTIDVADLPTSSDDTYDLGMQFENAYGQVRSVAVDTGLEVVSSGTAPDTSVASASVDRTSVEPGESVTVSANVENVGNAIGEHTATLEVDGSVEDATTVEVADGATEQVTFTHAFPDAGSYAVSVDGVSAGTVTVEAADDDSGSSPSPSPPPFPVPDPEPDVSVDDTDDGATVAVTDAIADEPVAIPLTGSATTNETNLTALEVTTTEDVDFEATIESSEEPPADASDLPDTADALLYLDVEHDLDDDQIEGAAFEFTVTADELGARGVEPGDVLLYHLVDGEWTERETTVLEERADAVDLRAEVPHFSWFAVAGGQASLEVTDGSIAGTELTAGDETVIDATVENAGTASGDANVSLAVDGEIVDAASVTVDAGDQEVVTFEHAFAESGTYEVAVDEVVLGSVTVSESPDDAGDDATGDGSAADDDADGDDAESDDGSPGFGVALALLALLTTALLARRHG